VTYRIQVARTAARQLTEQLPETVAAACVEFLYGPLAENPHRVGAPLRKPFEGYCGLGAGSTESGTLSMTATRPSRFWTSATGGMPTIDHKANGRWRQLN
jgi:hypothetical protein